MCQLMARDTESGSVIDIKSQFRVFSKPLNVMSVETPTYPAIGTFIPIPLEHFLPPILVLLAFPNQRICAFFESFPLALCDAL